MTDVVMPQMGESITEGTLTKWLKKVGDSVERDEPLFEISTDKVDTEIPSPVAGTLREMLVEEGETVEINTVVARVESADGAEAATSAEEPAAEAPAAEPTPPPPPPAAEPPAPTVSAPAAPAAVAAPKGPISPLVRRLAREHNIDLARVRGTGSGGRIAKSDIEAYLAARGAAPQAAAGAVASPLPPPEQVAPVPPAGALKMRVEPMSNMRKKIAEHMIFSKQTSAHVTTVHRVDMTSVAHIRNGLKAQFKERYGFSLTYLPFVLRAAAQALREYPIVNASIEGADILYHNEIHIGIAVALDNGLIVPVIRDADGLSIVGLQRSLVDLAGRARARRLKPDEVTGGTFSITNFGSFGSLFATPVINQPNVAILGIGAITKEPVVVAGDAIGIRSMAYLSLTFDHRLIDGALADQFTQRVKQILEGWTEQVL